MDAINLLGVIMFAALGCTLVVLITDWMEERHNKPLPLTEDQVKHLAPTPEEEAFLARMEEIRWEDWERWWEEDEAATRLMEEEKEAEELNELFDHLALLNQDPYGDYIPAKGRDPYDLMMQRWKRVDTGEYYGHEADPSWEPMSKGRHIHTREAFLVDGVEMTTHAYLALPYEWQYRVEWKQVADDPPRSGGKKPRSKK